MLTQEDMKMFSELLDRLYAKNRVIGRILSDHYRSIS